MEASSTPTVLEFFHLLPREGGSALIRASHRWVAPDPGFLDGDPNDQATRIIGFPASTWCHSTSWRTESSTLVLTFLVLSEAGSDGWPSQVTIDPARTEERPASQLELVLAHAVGHLHYLASKHDNVIGLVRELRLGHVLAYEPVKAGHYGPPTRSGRMEAD